jgi:hypothetical protein
MPYIKPEAREALERYPLSIADAGELNYMITRTINTYLRGRDVRYTRYNDVIGALECAKLEIYRRLIAPYEDAKQLENGDVYDHR